MAQYNEKLIQWMECKPSTEAGVGSIQVAGDVAHVVWQNRYREPTAYELSLVEHLTRAFSNGAVELNQVVAALNNQGMYDEAGDVWTAESFQSEMARLGY